MTVKAKCTRCKWRLQDSAKHRAVVYEAAMLHAKMTGHKVDIKG